LSIHHILLSFSLSLYKTFELEKLIGSEGNPVRPELIASNQLSLPSWGWYWTMIEQERLPARFLEVIKSS